MNIKHIPLERIVEISEKNVNLSIEEKLHIENCKICSRKIEISKMIPSAVKNNPEVEQLIDESSIEFIAENVFDIVSKQENSNRVAYTKVFKSISGIAAAILVVISFLNLFDRKNVVQDEIIKDNQELVVDNLDTNAETEYLQDETFQRKVIKIDKGSVLSGVRYNITAETESVIAHEHVNYFSVKTGVLHFRVQSGSDFMVNLNNVALIRVLGTTFTVSVGKEICSVNVTDGLVEIIDLERGISRSVAKGEKDEVKKVKNRINQKTDGVTAKNNSKEQTIDLSKNISLFFAHDTVKKSSKILPDYNDRDMMYALIDDLETALEFSDSPVIQLHQLFDLYKKTGHWGSIIHFWRTKSEKIDTRGNPFLKEMHFAACEASIKLYLYDNKICKKYKYLYPDGPDPEGINDHLEMAW